MKNLFKNMFILISIIMIVVLNIKTHTYKKKIRNSLMLSMWKDHLRNICINYLIQLQRKNRAIKMIGLSIKGVVWCYFHKK